MLIAQKTEKYRTITLEHRGNDKFILWFKYPKRSDKDTGFPFKADAGEVDRIIAEEGMIRIPTT